MGVGLARLGARHLTLFDEDCFDRTNAPRQLAYAADLQQQKAYALARNLLPHMTNAGIIVSVPSMFAERALEGPEAFELLLVGVDNNRARFAASRFGLARGVPVVFAMLSSDGMRARAFLQLPGRACLSCVLPDLDADAHAPCAAASIASCFLAAAHALELAVAALSKSDVVPCWRETSLDGTTERTGTPPRMPTCPACG
jgi:adenylyltransferase/sulfurtransferase